MERIEVYAPVHERGTLLTGPADVLRISRDEARYDEARYTVQRLTASAATCLAVRETYEDWSWERDRTQPVTVAEHERFREHLRGRLRAHGGAVLPQDDGDPAVAVPCEADLCRLALEDHRLVRDLFVALRESTDPGPAVEAAIERAA